MHILGLKFWKLWSPGNDIKYTSNCKTRIFGSIIYSKYLFVEFSDNLYQHYLEEGDVTPEVKGDMKRGEIVSDMTTTFVSLCAIYFPSVTGSEVHALKANFCVKRSPILPLIRDAWTPSIVPFSNKDIIFNDLTFQIEMPQYFIYCSILLRQLLLD